MHKTNLKFIANMLTIFGLFSFYPVDAHNFTPNESAAFLTLVDAMQSEIHLVPINIANNNILLAQEHAENAVELLNKTLIKEIEERNQRVADELTTALAELQNIQNANVSQPPGDINQTVSDIDAILEETVTIRIDQEQRNNATIQALALAGLIDAVLRNYGNAYEVGFDMSDRLQMVMDRDIDNYTMVNMADYQSAQALTLKCQEIFYDELKSPISENKINFINKLESDLMQLNDAINNKASPMYIIRIVHTHVHPNLLAAYNLKLQ
jgi:lipopolysaccharide biosynthesis regulator YciM